MDLNPSRGAGQASPQDAQLLRTDAAKVVDMLDGLFARTTSGPAATGEIQAPLADVVRGTQELAPEAFRSEIKAGAHIAHDRLARYAHWFDVRAEGLADDHVRANHVLDDLIATDPSTLTVGGYRRLEAVVDHADTLNFAMRRTDTLSSKMYGGSILRGFEYQTGPHTVTRDGAAIMPVISENDLLSSHVPARYMRELAAAIKAEAGPSRVKARELIERTRSEYVSASPDTLRSALAKRVDVDPQAMTISDRARLSGMLDAADETGALTKRRPADQARSDHFDLFSTTDLAADEVGPILSRIRLRLDGVEGAQRDAKLAEILRRDVSTWTNRDVYDLLALTEDAVRDGSARSDDLWQLNRDLRRLIGTNKGDRLDSVFTPHTFQSGGPDLRSTIEALRAG